MKSRREKKADFIGLKVPHSLVKALVVDAEFEGTSVSHIVRRILLDHYERRKALEGGRVAVPGNEVLDLPKASSL